MGKQGEAEIGRDQDVRDIASQVMVSTGLILQATIASWQTDSCVLPGQLWHPWEEIPWGTAGGQTATTSLSSPDTALCLLPFLQMLDVTVSQLLSLQPSLAARVTAKHRDVKESWAQLQQALR